MQLRLNSAITRQQCRIWITIAIIALIFCCIIAAVLIGIFGRQPVAVYAMSVPFVTLIYMLRWPLTWFSTEAERKFIQATTMRRLAK